MVGPVCFCPLSVDDVRACRTTSIIPNMSSASKNILEFEEFEELVSSVMNEIKAKKIRDYRQVILVNTQND